MQIAVVLERQDIFNNPNTKTDDILNRQDIFKNSDTSVYILIWKCNLLNEIYYNITNLKIYINITVGL